MTINAPAPAHDLVPDAWTLAQELARAGHSVALDGIVAHHTGTKTLACYAALASLAGVTGLVWPSIGVVALLAIAISALRDLDGGDGFVRRLLVRDIGHTIIIWPPNEAPDANVDDQPTLLVTAPLEERITLRAAPPWVFIGLLSVGLLAALGCVLQIAWPQVGEGLVIGCSSTLLVGAIVSWSFGWVRSEQPPGNPARRALRSVLDGNIRTDRIRLVFALIGGGTLHHDGMEILLRNHQHRLPPSTTRVLVLHPYEGPIGVVGWEGRARSVAADPWMIAVAQHAGIQTVRNTTAASRALREGWKAAALTVAPDQTHLAAQTIRTMIDRAEKEAAE